METRGNSQQLKQTRFIFWLNLALTVFAMAVLIKSIDSNVPWKIICAGTGFLILLVLTILLFVRMMRLRKR